jgi:hypothetical protein
LIDSNRRIKDVVHRVPVGRLACSVRAVFCESGFAVAGTAFRARRASDLLVFFWCETTLWG